MSYAPREVPNDAKYIIIIIIIIIIILHHHHHHHHHHPTEVVPAEAPRLARSRSAICWQFSVKNLDHPCQGPISEV
jgi:hypothetical protein